MQQKADTAGLTDRQEFASLIVRNRSKNVNYKRSDCEH